MVKLVSQQDLVDRTHTVLTTMPSAISGYESRIQFITIDCRRVNNASYFFSQNVHLNTWILSTTKKTMATRLSNFDHSNKQKIVRRDCQGKSRKKCPCILLKRVSLSQFIYSFLKKKSDFLLVGDSWLILYYNSIGY